MVSCLLCNGDCCSSNSSTRSSSSSSQISNQLRVVFLLRNVFEIPREKLEVFLRTNHGDHPSEWIDLCDTCEDTVKKGHRIYREFLKISSMLRTVKKDIVEVTRKGIQEGQGQSSDGGRDSISREIKQFVDKYNYGEFNNILNVSPVDIHPERPEPLAKILGEPEVKVEPEPEDNHVTVQNEGQAEEAEFQDFQDSLDDPLDLDHEEDVFQVKARRSPEFVDDAEDSNEDDEGGAFSAGADTGNDQSDLESGAGQSRKSRKFRKRQFKGRRSSSKTGGAGRPAFLRRAKEYKMKSNARKLVRDAKTLYLPCPFCHETAKDYSEEGEINLCDHLENCTNLQTSSTGELKCQNCGNFRCSFDAKARFVEHIGNCEGRRHDHHVIPLEKRIFVCNVCPKKVYMMLDEFNRHIVYHQKNTFQCTKCQMLFETSLFAEEHWELEHQDDDDDDDPKWTQEPVILPAADWWCHLCNQGPFPTDDVRDEHLKTDHSEEEFKGVEKSRNRGCSFCPKQFASILELQLHRNMFHFREHHAFKCDHADCRNENDFKTEAELKEHRLSSHQLNFLYSCHICAEQLSSKVLWLNHLEAHQKAKDSKTCEICNKPFRTALMLKRHIRVDHKKLERVPCDYCDKTFKNEFHLRSHLGCHGLGEISCTQEGCTQKLSTQNKLKLHLAKVHKIGEFKCSICDQGFFTRNLLERHGRVHATDRPFNCKICGRGFKDSWNCEKHEKLHEINPNLKKRREFDMTTLDGTKRNVIKKLNSNRVICDLCGKSVPDLARHKNFFHRPKAPKVKRKYIPKVAKVCPECGKMVVDMYQHRQWCLDNPRVPKKIDPCICELCGKNFVRRENLRLHVRTVHERKMEVECEVCKKTFKSKVYLQDHMVQVHGVKKEEFRCCDKVFESRLQLYSHRRKHHWKSGTLPLQCNLCGNTYPCARSLSRHIQTHENRMEKPYECDACHKKFALRGYLNQHKQKHCPHRNKTSTN